MLAMKRSMKRDWERVSVVCREAQCDEILHDNRYANSNNFSDNFIVVTSLVT